MACRSRQPTEPLCSQAPLHAPSSHLHDAACIRHRLPEPPRLSVVPHSPTPCREVPRQLQRAHGLPEHSLPRYFEPDRSTRTSAQARASNNASCFRHGHGRDPRLHAWESEVPCSHAAGCCSCQLSADSADRSSAVWGVGEPAEGGGESAIDADWTAVSRYLEPGCVGD